MTDPVVDESVRVSFKAMVFGFRQAVGRFQAASEGSDPAAAAIPLFEALNWAVSLDERIRKDWVPDGPPPIGWDWPARLGNDADAEAVRGVRFIRHRVQHQWADALRLSKPVRRYPARRFDWVWAPVASLPESDKGNRGREDYERILEGMPADVTLSLLAETYELMLQLLEPLASRTSGLRD